MREDEKNHRRAILQNFKDNERTQYLSSLPDSESEIKALFDYLNENPDDCDDTLRQTTKFIKERNLPEKEMIAWLNENGGFCDCEVLANVEDNWNQMIGVK
ncbi:MAG TPA: DUF2695 domain-containing protein [Pyrinomonadaceae bacterium]|jgi:hypothetical protein